jgi:hypothetical protein
MPNTDQYIANVGGPRGPGLIGNVGGGPPPVQHSGVTLGPIQLGGAGTPIVIVAAVPGSIIVPLSVSYVYDFGTTPYHSSFGTATGGIWYGSRAGEYADNLDNEVVLSAVSTFENSGIAEQDNSLDTYESLPLVYQTNNGADYIGGDGTLSINIDYIMVAG